MIVPKNADAPVKPAGDDKTIPLKLYKEVALVAGGESAATCLLVHLREDKTIYKS